MTIGDFIFIFIILAIVYFFIFGLVEDYLIKKAGEKVGKKENPKTINDYWKLYKAEQKAKEVPNATFIYEEKTPVLKPNVKITSPANVETIYDILQDLKKYDAFKKNIDKFLASSGEGKRLKIYFDLIDDKKGSHLTCSIDELSEDLGEALLATIDDHFEAMKKSISRYVDGI